MIIGRIEKITTMKFYDQNGQFLGEGASCDYRAILLWRDVIIGLIIVFLAFTQTI